MIHAEVHRCWGSNFHSNIRTTGGYSRGRLYSEVAARSRFSMLRRICRRAGLVPLVLSLMSGGYAMNVEDTITIHANTAAVAREMLLETL